jgi:hypothetical protein
MVLSQGHQSINKEQTVDAGNGMTGIWHRFPDSLLVGRNRVHQPVW